MQFVFFTHVSFLSTFLKNAVNCVRSNILMAKSRPTCTQRRSSPPKGNNALPVFHAFPSVSENVSESVRNFRNDLS